MPTVFDPARRSAAVLPFLLAAAVPAAADDGADGRPFDQTRVAWEDDAARRAAGLAAAGAFRGRLLRSPDGGGPTGAALLGDAIERFRTAHRAPPADRPGLGNFTVTAERFVAGLRGDPAPGRVEPGAAFGAFAGRWYGVWDGRPVDHHWHAVRRPPPAGSLADRGSLPELAALQFAWVGDGFGWNYLARPPGAAGPVVLGHVWHLHPFAEGREGAVKSWFPLVGLADGPGRLVWATPFAVYFEEAFAGPDGAGPDAARYAITGFRYEWAGGAAVPAGEGFRAVYTRRPDDRPAFRTFPLEPAEN